MKGRSSNHVCQFLRHVVGQVAGELTEPGPELCSTWAPSFFAVEPGPDECDFVLEAVAEQVGVDEIALAVSEVSN